MTSPYDAAKERLLNLPEAQLREVGRLAQLHPDCTWHFAACGCCICLHPTGDVKRGWLIGPDGEAEYHEPEEA